MIECKRFYPYGGPAGIPPGVFDSHYKRSHDRPDYTREQAQEVAYWLNGTDLPLPTVKGRVHDEWDPRNRHAARLRRRTRGQTGLTPLD